MRYILDDTGYIYSVSCNPFECNNKGCTGYTGAIPDGYDTLEQWATTANIRAYKVIDGQLVYDAAKAAELEAEWSKPCENIAAELIKTATYENAELTLNSGNNHTITFSGVEIAGYTPVGVIQIDTSNNNITLQKFSIWSTNAYITIRNTTSSAQKFTTKITVLFVKKF